ncbi:MULTISPECIES: hypothetical protein [Halorussus]|uniref:hypothetical protein n=1 Tax=Halorussus TaxID=1070314 RepID=UPI0013B37DD7|nr:MULTISPECIES: hypothetical protein [Halorussus]NHN57727.1 hypothetical protein [Halorussus sp. JP-T4]
MPEPTTAGDKTMGSTSTAKGHRRGQTMGSTSTAKGHRRGRENDAPADGDEAGRPVA